MDLPGRSTCALDVIMHEGITNHSQCSRRASGSFSLLPRFPLTPLLQCQRSRCLECSIIMLSDPYPPRANRRPTRICCFRTSLRELLVVSCWEGSCPAEAWILDRRQSYFERNTYRKAFSIIEGMTRPSKGELSSKHGLVLASMSHTLKFSSIIKSSPNTSNENSFLSGSILV